MSVKSSTSTAPESIGEAVARVPDEHKPEAIRKAVASVPSRQVSSVAGQLLAAVPDDQKLDVAGRAMAAVPQYQKQEVAGQALAAVPDDQKSYVVGRALASLPEKARDEVMRSTGPLDRPSQSVTNFIWMAIFVILAAVIIGGGILGLGARDGDETALYGFVGIALGALVGLLAPSPYAGKK
jgi:hypothetical protein